MYQVPNYIIIQRRSSPSFSKRQKLRLTTTEPMYSSCPAQSRFKALCSSRCTALKWIIGAGKGAGGGTCNGVCRECYFLLINAVKACSSTTYAVPLPFWTHSFSCVSDQSSRPARLPSNYIAIGFAHGVPYRRPPGSTAPLTSDPH